MPIPALIGAGASILGGMFGASSTKKTNDSNLRINQMNNEFNERMMQKQMDYNTMMWNKQNAYNDPSAQVNRLKAAGLNPYMMMNGGSAGNAESFGSSSAASAAGAAPQQAFHPDFQGIPQSILMSKQGANIDEDTYGKVIDNRTKALRNLADISRQIAETKNTNIRSKLSQIQYNYADEMAQVQLQNEKTRGENLLREGLLQEKELSIFDERTRLDFAQRSANILLTYAQKQMTKQQAIHEIQKMYLTCAQHSGQKISNDVARRSAQSIVDKAKFDAYYKADNPIGLVQRIGQRLDMYMSQ